QLSCDAGAGQSAEPDLVVHEVAGDTEVLAQLFDGHQFRDAAHNSSNPHARRSAMLLVLDGACVRCLTVAATGARASPSRSSWRVGVVKTSAAWSAGHPDSTSTCIAPRGPSPGYPAVHPDSSMSSPLSSRSTMRYGSCGSSKPGKRTYASTISVSRC